MDEAAAMMIQAAYRGKRVRERKLRSRHSRRASAWRAHASLAPEPDGLYQPGTVAAIAATLQPTTLSTT